MSDALDWYDALPEVRGLDVVERREGNAWIPRAVGLRARPGAADPDFRSLLDWLPEGCQLSFYDPHHPQMSDPGAYVTIRRRPPNRDGKRWLEHRLANHGWSSRWAVQSAELMAAYLAVTQVPQPVFVGEELIWVSAGPASEEEG